MKCATFVVCVLGFLNLTTCEKRGDLRVRLLSFSNRQGLDYHGLCCDGARPINNVCGERCDYVIKIVVSSVNRDLVDHIYLSESPLQYNHNSIDFTQKDTSLPEIQIPLSIWPGLVQLRVYIYDYEGQHRRAEMVDSFNVTLSRNDVSNPLYTIVETDGNRVAHKTRLTLQWMVTCTNSTCVPRPSPALPHPSHNPSSYQSRDNPTTPRWTHVLNDQQRPDTSPPNSHTKYAFDNHSIASKLKHFTRTHQDDKNNPKIFILKTRTLNSESKNTIQICFTKFYRTNANTDKHIKPMFTVKNHHKYQYTSYRFNEIVRSFVNYSYGDSIFDRMFNDSPHFPHTSTNKTDNKKLVTSKNKPDHETSTMKYSSIDEKLLTIPKHMVTGHASHKKSYQPFSQESTGKSSKPTRSSTNRYNSHSGRFLVSRYLPVTHESLSYEHPMSQTTNVISHPKHSPTKHNVTSNTDKDMTLLSSTDNLNTSKLIKTEASNETSTYITVEAKVITEDNSVIINNSPSSRNRVKSIPQNSINEEFINETVKNQSWNHDKEMADKETSILKSNSYSQHTTLARILNKPSTKHHNTTTVENLPVNTPRKNQHINAVDTTTNYKDKKDIQSTIFQSYNFKISRTILHKNRTNRENKLISKNNKLATDKFKLHTILKKQSKTVYNSTRSDNFSEQIRKFNDDFAILTDTHVQQRQNLPSVNSTVHNGRSGIDVKSAIPDKHDRIQNVMLNDIVVNDHKEWDRSTNSVLLPMRGSKEMSFETILLKYWPTIVALLAGVAFMAGAVVSSIYCKKHRVVLRRRVSLQHVSQPSTLSSQCTRTTSSRSSSASSIRTKPQCNEPSGVASTSNISVIADSTINEINETSANKRSEISPPKGKSRFVDSSSKLTKNYAIPTRKGGASNKHAQIGERSVHRSNCPKQSHLELSSLTSLASNDSNNSALSNQHGQTCVKLSHERLSGKLSKNKCSVIDHNHTKMGGKSFYRRPSGMASPCDMSGIVVISNRGSEGTQIENNVPSFNRQSGLVSPSSVLSVTDLSNQYSHRRPSMMSPCVSSTSASSKSHPIKSGSKAMSGNTNSNKSHHRHLNRDGIVENSGESILSLEQLTSPRKKLGMPEKSHHRPTQRSMKSPSHIPNRDFGLPSILLNSGQKHTPTSSGASATSLPEFKSYAREERMKSLFATSRSLPESYPREERMKSLCSTLRSLPESKSHNKKQKMKLSDVSWHILPHSGASHNHHTQHRNKSSHQVGPIKSPESKLVPDEQRMKSSDSCNILPPSAGSQHSEHRIKASSW